MDALFLLHSAITHLVEGEPLRIVMGSTSGLETLRWLSKQCHPRSFGTTRQILTKLLNLKTCKSFTELDAAMLKMAELIRECDSMSTQPLADDVKAATSGTRRISPTPNSRIASPVGFLARKKETQSPEQDGDQLEW